MVAPVSRSEWREILSKHFLLHHLDDSEWQSLLAFAHLRRCTPREILFQKGDAGNALLAILRGRIKISTLSEEGKEVVLNILGPGELFGEIALIDGKERTADAVVMEPSELLVIDAADFMPFLKQRPELCVRLLAVLCGRIRWVSDLYEDVVFLNLPARLAKHLLRLAEHFGHQVPDGTRISLKLSQQDLGNLMGTTRESINKVMGVWQSEGLLTMERGVITIRQPGALENLSTSL